ncbi:MAG: HAD family hydrolase [Planctomyces sp.]|jgi:HAD superfamily hydrolase (TIGR01509 family)
MTIRTCFFDMGNVLVHFSHEKMCDNIAALCQWPLDRVRQYLIEEGRQWAMERGEMTEEQFQRDLSLAAGRSIDPEQLRIAAADIFCLNDSIVSVLQKLKSSGVRLVLLSNTSITHLRFIEERFDVLRYMDDRVTSFEVGVLKPESAIFEAALRKAECPPDKCFYTDDILPYIEKARTFGIHAHQYTTTEQLISDLRMLNVPVP